MHVFLICEFLLQYYILPTSTFQTLIICTFQIIPSTTCTTNYYSTIITTTITTTTITTITAITTTTLTTTIQTMTTLSTELLLLLLPTGTAKQQLSNADLLMHQSFGQMYTYYLVHQSFETHPD